MWGVNYLRQALKKKEVFTQSNMVFQKGGLSKQKF